MSPISIKVGANVSELLETVLTHRREFPLHGTNCSCMDQISWEIERQVHTVVPGPLHELPEDKRSAWESMSHVLQMVVRNFQ